MVPCAAAHSPTAEAEASDVRADDARTRFCVRYLEPGREHDGLVKLRVPKAGIVGLTARTGEKLSLIHI